MENRPIPEDRPATKQDIDAAVQSLTSRQDRAVEAIATEISDLRTEMNARFTKLDSRLDTIERRTERIELNMSAVLLQTAGMSKSLSEAERIDSGFAATLAAQQRAIDDLYAQLAQLKRQQQPPQQ